MYLNSIYYLGNNSVLQQFLIDHQGLILFHYEGNVFALYIHVVSYYFMFTNDLIKLSL